MSDAIQMLNSPYDNIVEDTTVTFNQWLKSMEKATRDPIISGMVEPRAGIYLRDHVEAWIDAPIAYVDGRAVHAKSTKITSLHEFKEALEKSGKKIIMYTIRWMEPTPQFSYDSYSYEGESRGYWIIRGEIPKDIIT